MSEGGEAVKLPNMGRGNSKFQIAPFVKYENIIGSLE